MVIQLSVVCCILCIRCHAVKYCLLCGFVTNALVSSKKKSALWRDDNVGRGYMTDYLLDFLAVSSCIIKNVIQSVRLRLLDLHTFWTITHINNCKPYSLLEKVFAYYRFDLYRLTFNALLILSKGSLLVLVLLLSS